MRTEEINGTLKAERKRESMKLLKNSRDIENLLEALDKCRGDVVLRSTDGREDYSLQNEFSRYIAIGELCTDNADNYEMFCLRHADETHMLHFFYTLDQERAKAA